MLKNHAFLFAIARVDTGGGVDVEVYRDANSLPGDVTAVHVRRAEAHPGHMVDLAGDWIGYLPLRAK